VTLLDAYALIAFMVGGPAAPIVRASLREGDAAVASANLAETLDVSQRLYRLPIPRAMEILEPLLEGPLSAIALDLEIARRAAEIRAGHYHRASRPLSLADAVLIASAKSGDRIATADPHVLAVAREEKLDLLVLPEQG
jgi:predicted nucleic acid-binding protein